jgi:hypothetical protein
MSDGLAERQIGAADRSGEQQVAAERDAVAGEGHESRCVTRHVHHLKSQRSANDLLAVGELGVRTIGLLEIDAVHLRGAGGQPSVVREIEGMQMHRHVEPAFDRGDGTDVIDVRVREPDRVERHPGGRHHLYDAVALVAGIDQDGAVRLVVGQEIAVLLEHPDGALIDSHTA